ncbi:MATE family efflux transporter [Methanosphaera sp. ISO3-F5]|uniref:MATE family efflux transporter n=1 Tax=Methanosphaera sp. ISO3-F5 TaxID=1452353 RepID=UPI002B25AC41|nr:MATE family efflux transporter [Methanosphaera sp. ISO3-F5]WQH63956.1 MATE family efflux transporter [Methanosphaera sp. ISO3-F5]
MQENKGKNSNIELLTGDYKVAIKKLAWPMMVSMFLIMAYNLADSIWVAGLGSDALAAIGFITPLFMILVGLGNGIGAGANSMIARFVGAKNIPEANNTALHSLVLTVIISILGSVVMYFILPSLLQIMGAGTATQQALDYGGIVFTFMIIFIYSNVGTAILRSEGDVKRAMYVMAITAIFNIVLDPIFIYILGFGIMGAAWATVLSGFISCLVLLYWMHIKKDTFLNLEFKNFHYENSITWGILNVAIPSTAENLIFSALGIIENYFLVLVSGTIAVATYTAGMRLIQLSMIPLMGFGTALLTVAGASYGARNYQKLQDSFFYTLKLGLIVSTIMAIVFYFFAPQISMVFAYSSSASLAPRIAQLIQIMIIFIYAVCLGMVSAMMFQGVGKGFTSLILTFIRALLLEVVFSYVFGVLFGWGEQGIYYGVVLGGFLGGIISFIWANVYLRRLRNNYHGIDE